MADHARVDLMADTFEACVDRLTPA
jgi:hypothetical protein